MKLILTSIKQKDLTTIQVDLMDKKIALDPQKHLQFSGDFKECNEFLGEHATLIALTRTAEAEALELESRIAGQKAIVDGKIRNEWDPSGPKITEAAVLSLVRSNGTVQDLEKDLLSARRDTSILQGFLNASSVKYAQVVAYLYTNSTTKQ